MRTSITTLGKRNYSEFKASRPHHTQPVITGTYRDPDGVRMYLGEEGRTFIADAFDRIWKVVPGLVKPIRYKGKNPDTTKDFLK